MDKLFHIVWGDGDNAFVLAPDESAAQAEMGDIRDMIRTVCELPSVFQEIFELGEGAERKRILGNADKNVSHYEITKNGIRKKMVAVAFTEDFWQALKSEPKSPM